MVALSKDFKKPHGRQILVPHQRLYRASFKVPLSSYPCRPSPHGITHSHSCRSMQYLTATIILMGLLKLGSNEVNMLPFTLRFRIGSVPVDLHSALILGHSRMD